MDLNTPAARGVISGPETRLKFAFEEKKREFPVTEAGQKLVFGPDCRQLVLVPRTRTSTS